MSILYENIENTRQEVINKIQELLCSDTWARAPEALVSSLDNLEQIVDIINKVDQQ